MEQICISALLQQPLIAAGLAPGAAADIQCSNRMIDNLIS
jgi:hypothetical protein